ncbi:MFS domain-containing protein [Fusarium keratoplasticum]|nr:MFS domain-containing protein [Fusarium keratoplasticum]
MLIAGGGIMIVGAAILASPYTVAQLIVDRIVTGIGNGMNSSTAPVYQSECSPAAIRGALLTLQGTVTILGVVISYWMDYGTSFTESSLQWRFRLAFQALFAILLILQVIGLPVSPRWLVQHEQYEEARHIIAAIADKPDDDADELFFWGEVQNLRRLLTAISIQLVQQFSGSNMINYYAPVIFQGSIGLSRNTPLIVGGCSQITYLIGSCIPVFWMDRYGRQTLLMACSAGLSFCFVMVSILLSLGSTGSAYGATAFIFLFQLIKGGVTGGVLSSKGGRTVMLHQHAQEMQLDAKVGGVREEVEDVQA